MSRAPPARCTAVASRRHRRRDFAARSSDRSGSHPAPSLRGGKSPCRREWREETASWRRARSRPPRAARPRSGPGTDAIPRGARLDSSFAPTYCAGRAATGVTTSSIAANNTIAGETLHRLRSRTAPASGVTVVALRPGRHARPAGVRIAPRGRSGKLPPRDARPPVWTAPGAT